MQASPLRCRPELKQCVATKIIAACFSMAMGLGAGGTDAFSFQASAVRDYAAKDPSGQRVSLKIRPEGITIHRGGDAEYFIPSTAAKNSAASLFRGETLDLKPVSGHAIERLRSPLKISLQPGATDGAPTDALPVHAVSPDWGGDFNLVFAEDSAPNSSFTLVTYNVENLFDQIDEARNEAYGDYRLKPNGSGQSSNYGETVSFEGRQITYTEAKILGVRRALTALDPSGPDIVALQEVESKVVTDQLLAAMRDLGYRHAVFTDWPSFMGQMAVGQAILSKYPVAETKLVPVLDPKDSNDDRAQKYQRPILRVAVEVAGHRLYVYNGHWKSKSGPESMRIAAAEAQLADIEALLAQDPKADYVVVGDLNSNYNEAESISDELDDSDGLTGINDVLKAQGDEVKVTREKAGSLHYDLYYELASKDRRSAYHDGFGWSSMDHIILGRNLYDAQGITYVDNSFQVAKRQMPRLSHLFDAEGLTNRWHSKRSRRFTTHSLGGFSDHLPLMARFHVRKVQSAQTIELYKPSRQD